MGRPEHRRGGRGYGARGHTEAGCSLSAGSFGCADSSAQSQGGPRAPEERWAAHVGRASAAIRHRRRRSGADRRVHVAAAQARCQWWAWWATAGSAMAPPGVGEAGAAGPAGAARCPAVARGRRQGRRAGRLGTARATCSPLRRSAARRSRPSGCAGRGGWAAEAAVVRPLRASASAMAPAVARPEGRSRTSRLSSFVSWPGRWSLAS